MDHTIILNVHLAIFYVLLNFNNQCDAWLSSAKATRATTTVKTTRRPVRPEDLYEHERKMANVSAIPIVIPANGTHTATLFFLPSIGDTKPLWAEEIAKIAPPYLKIISPLPDEMPVHSLMPEDAYPGDTLIQSSWFNGTECRNHDDHETLARMVNYIHSLIEREVKVNGIHPKRIILGGYKQGGALAVHAALTYPRRLAGMLSIAFHLGQPRVPSKPFNDNNFHIPIMLFNAVSDIVASYNIPTHKYGPLPGEALREIVHFKKFEVYPVLQEPRSKKYEYFEDFLRSVLPPKEK